jgi:hypothetical protein
MFESLSTKEIIGYSAGLISFINMFWYMRGVLRGSVKPTLAYWLLAEVAMLLIIFSAFALWDRTTLWIAVAYASTQVIIIGLAIKHKNIWLRGLDYYLLGLAWVSILLWWYTKNPLYTLMINVGIDASGYIPLWRQIWKNPETEDTIYWAIAGSASVLNMFAVGSFTFESILYPWYLGIVNALTFFILIRKYLFKSYGKTLRK